MRIDSAGKVGIGSDTPESSLRVSGTLDGSPSIKAVHMGVESFHRVGIKLVSTSIGTASMNFNSPDDTYNGSTLCSNNNDVMNFYTGKAERMTLNSTGLGIGYSSATEKLDVLGNIRAFGDIIVGEKIKH